MDVDTRSTVSTLARHPCSFIRSPGFKRDGWIVRQGPYSGLFSVLMVGSFKGISNAVAVVDRGGDGGSDHRVNPVRIA